MIEHGGGAEQSPFVAVEPPGASGTVGLDTLPAPDEVANVLEPVPDDFGAPFDGPSGASLVGSLTVFPLADVLLLLSSVGQTGELQVEGDAAEGSLWLEAGQLTDAQVGTATTMGQAIFELACLVDGWFSFLTDSTSSSGHPPVPVEGVLAEVRHQIDEWREIRKVVPLTSSVVLSPTPPGQDVQIRSDQWQVLTTVGTSGQSVESVLEAIGGDQIAGLRTLRDLLAEGLIIMSTDDNAPAGVAGAQPPPFAVVPSTPFPVIPPGGLSDEPADERRRASSEPVQDGSTDPATEAPPSLAEVSIMPPPIAEDPWTPVAQANGPADNGVA